MDEVVVRLRLEKLEGIHVEVGVFAGPDEDHFGKCGTITFRIDEWEALRDGKGKFQLKVLGEMPKPGWYLSGLLGGYHLLEHIDLVAVKRSL